MHCITTVRKGDTLEPFSTYRPSIHHPEPVSGCVCTCARYVRAVHYIWGQGHAVKSMRERQIQKRSQSLDFSFKVGEREKVVPNRVRDLPSEKEGKKGGKETLREATMAIEIKHDTLNSRKIKERKNNNPSPGRNGRTVSQRSNSMCSAYMYQRLTKPTLNVPTKRSMAIIFRIKDPRGIETRSHTEGPRGEGKPSSRGSRIYQ